MAIGVGESVMNASSRGVRRPLRLAMGRLLKEDLMETIWKFEAPCVDDGVGAVWSSVAGGNGEHR